MSSPMRRHEKLKKLDPANVRALADDHKVVVDGKTLFPTRVFDPMKGKKILISGVNCRKIGSKITKGPWKGMPIFTLTLEERATCPRGCLQWNTCYGNNMQWARRNLAGIGLENLVWLEVRDLIAKHGKIAIRLHVLGDFYSVRYVNVWRWLVERFEGLHIFGFTAHGQNSDIGMAIARLNREFPDRFVIRWSGLNGILGARVLEFIPKGPWEAGAFVCPAQSGATDCCGTCGLCWSPTMKRKPVAFVLHGAKKRGPNKPKSRQKYWTNDTVAKVTRLWKEGYSAAQIARQVPHHSREAIIGKLHRLGLTHKNERATPGINIADNPNMPITLVSSCKTQERFTYRRGEL